MISRSWSKKLSSSQLDFRPRLRFTFKFCIFKLKINLGFDKTKKILILTLRRPLRHSWRIGLFFSSHGSALTAIPKRWKNIPHKSSTADFLKLFILMQGACGTDKTRLKILESDFTYYGVYSFWTFCVCLNFFCSITQKQVLKHL